MSAPIEAETIENPLITKVNKELAENQCKYIARIVKEFEKNLDDNTETAIKLASFGKELVMSVDFIGYQNPSLILFHGFVGDSRATLIQNVNQLNFMLMSATKREPDKPANRIGFTFVREEQG